MSCASVAVLAGPAPAEQPEPGVLLRALGFTASETDAIHRALPVAKSLDSDRRQIAIVGAVRVDGSAQRFADRYRRIDHLKRSAIVLDAGVFERSPRADDLQSAPFEPYDLDVRACRPGDCHVRLSADDINRFQRTVDWNAPDWMTQSAAVWRAVLAEYAAAYQRRGPAGMPIYANKKELLNVRDEFSSLVRDSGVVSAYLPEVFRFLEDPALRSDKIEDLLYWSKEDFGIRPVFRITHQAIYIQRSRPDREPLVAVVTNQVYAGHYIDAALTVTLAIPTESSSFYMVSVNRARTRSLTGMLRAFVRSTVQSRCRDAMLKILRATKQGLETSYQ